MAARTGSMCSTSLLESSTLEYDVFLAYFFKSPTHRQRQHDLAQTVRCLPLIRPCSGRVGSPWLEDPRSASFGTPSIATPPRHFRRSRASGTLRSRWQPDLDTRPCSQSRGLQRLGPPSVQAAVELQTCSNGQPAPQLVCQTHLPSPRGGRCGRMPALPSRTGRQLSSTRTRRQRLDRFSSQAAGTNSGTVPASRMLETEETLPPPYSIRIRIKFGERTRALVSPRRRETTTTSSGVSQFSRLGEWVVVEDLFVLCCSASVDEVTKDPRMDRVLRLLKNDEPSSWVKEFRYRSARVWMVPSETSSAVHGRPIPRSTNRKANLVLGVASPDVFEAGHNSAHHVQHRGPYSLVFTHVVHERWQVCAVPF